MLFLNVDFPQTSSKNFASQTRMSRNFYERKNNSSLFRAPSPDKTRNVFCALFSQRILPVFLSIEKLPDTKEKETLFDK